VAGSVRLSFDRVLEHDDDDDDERVATYQQKPVNPSSLHLALFAHVALSPVGAGEMEGSALKVGSADGATKMGEPDGASELVGAGLIFWHMAKETSQVERTKRNC